MYNAVCYEKNRLKMVSILFLLLLIVLLPTEISYASNPVAIMNSSYSVQVCENGTWKSPEKELIFGNYGSVHRDGILHFMPLKKYVYTQRLPRITPSDDFSYRVISKEPDVSLDYSYAIYNQNWETVLSGETTTPDLSGLDSGKYLMVINVYAKRDDYSEKCLNLVWLIVGDYEETFVFKPLDDGTYHLFEYCGTDEYVEIPSCYQECPVTKVEANAFKGNNVVKTIVVPEGIQEIGDFAFRSCTSLEKVVLSEGVIKIGEDAFASCTSLKDISLPSTLTKIGRRAFSGCKNLKSIMIPKNIYKIERGTFEDCSSLFEVILPSWLLSIEDEAFNRCYALKKVELPEGLLSIGSSAFDGIEFKNLVVPSSLLIIGKHAFSQYSRLLVHTGSLAETYAQSNHLPYSRLNEDYVWLPKKDQMDSNRLQLRVNVLDDHHAYIALFDPQLKETYAVDHTSEYDYVFPMDIKFRDSISDERLNVQLFYVKNKWSESDYISLEQMDADLYVCNDEGAELYLQSLFVQKNGQWLIWNVIVPETAYFDSEQQIDFSFYNVSEYEIVVDVANESRYEQYTFAADKSVVIPD